jgi:amino acid adenylation domain-containing protein
LHISLVLECAVFAESMTPELKTNPDFKIALPTPMDSWAGEVTKYPRNQTVARLFEFAAIEHASRTAVVCGEEAISYDELNRKANRLAHCLRASGVGPETMVGLCLARSIEMIVALLGILKAGGAYVPFDASYPRERLEFMIADTRTEVMVTQKSLKGVAGGSGTVQTVLVDEEIEGSAENPVPSAGPANLAYVMYTSGSTGRPKGVLVENRSVVRLVFNTNYCKFGADQTFLQFAPISFDASTLEIWGALLHGGKLVLVPQQAPSLEEIGKTIREEGVTTAWLTAGLFHLFVDERLEDLRSLKQLLAGGDTVSAKHVRRVLNAFPEMTVINGYGPTEGTTFTCCHAMRADDTVPDSVPIGRPISNTRVYILNDEMKPVRQGEAGELYTGGDGVARGYLNAPEVSAKKFLRDPFANAMDARMYRVGDFARWREDGSIEFLGRKDGQIKILGHRIELGEIESTLAQHAAVKQACVTAKIDEAGAKRLVAYYVQNGRELQSWRELKSFLAAKLPVYMVPAHYVPMTSLPLNPNGKIDRGALPDPVGKTSATEVPPAGNELETAIADVWKNVLRADHVGLDDNFFDLGGDSLLLVAVHSQLKKRLDGAIQVMDLFDHTTVRALAKHLSATAGETKSFDAAQERAAKQRAAFAKQRALRVGRPA